MTDPDSPNTENPLEAPLKKPTLLQVYGSVISGIFGVQSKKNRERDFTKGDPKQFAIVYISIVIGMVLSVLTLVQFVLRSATG